MNEKIVKNHAFIQARNKWCPDCKIKECSESCINNYRSRHSLVKEFVNGYMCCHNEYMAFIDKNSMIKNFNKSVNEETDN